MYKRRYIEDKKYTIKKNQFGTRYKRFIMELFISTKHSVYLIKGERENFRDNDFSILENIFLNEARPLRK